MQTETTDPGKEGQNMISGEEPTEEFLETSEHHGDRSKKVSILLLGWASIRREPPHFADVTL